MTDTTQPARPRRHSLPCHIWTRRTAQRGDNVLETVVIAGVLMLALVGAIQLVIWYMGQHIAALAADSAAANASISGSSMNDGSVAARNRLADVNILRDTTVTGTRSAGRVQFVVAGRIPGIIPGLPTRVRKTGVAALEETTR